MLEDPMKNKSRQLRGTDSRIMHLEIPSRLEELPSQGDIVVYCRSGQRSDAVARFIVDSGLCNGMIYNLLGGINAWSDEVDPTLSNINVVYIIIICLFIVVIIINIV